MHIINYLLNRIAFILVSFIFLSTFFVNSAFTQPLASDLPLQSIKPEVRTITIQIRDIFEGDDLELIYKLANNLKIKTRERVIKRELLFKVGQEYDAGSVIESERILRNISFIREVHIVPVVEGEYVDILVSAQATWTVFPQFSFALGGGDNSSEIGLSESNLFGYGKKIGFFLSENEGREATEFLYDDPRLFNSQYRLRFSGTKREDGFNQGTVVSRPFRSLLQGSAWEINFSSFDLVQSLFRAGNERFIFRQENTLLQSSYSFARFPREGLIRRFGLGFSYLKDNFTQANTQDFADVDVDPDSVESNDPSRLEENRDYRGILFGYRQIESDYKTFQYVDRFERELDYNIGIDYGFNVLFASTLLNSSDDVALIDSFFRDGFTFSDTSMLRYALQYRTRVDSNGLDNSIFNGQVKYYNVLGPVRAFGKLLGRHTIASSIMIDSSENLDKNLEFLFGASNGLRGYENNSFTGDHRIRFNTEYRMHHVQNWLQLLNIGSALFFDGGGASSASVGRVFRSDFYSNIGFGLRLGFPRSSGGGVLSLDIAFPLRDGPSNTEQFAPTYYVSAGQAFSSFFPGESTTVQTVSSEFLR